MTTGLHHGHKKSANHITPSRTHKTDAVDIGILTPEKTQALLNRQLADKLEARFKEEGVELKGLQASDFTPEKVSERILGFVSGRILAGEDKEQQSQLMQQAREGIEQGFAEARDILDSLDVLSGRIKEDVDSTYDLIQQGLDRIQQQIDGVTDNDKDGDKPASIAELEQASIAHSFSRNENTRVEITTRDGDTVLIDLFKQHSAQSSQSMSHSENDVSYSQSRSLSASAGITYQVQGELDEGEQKAIDELLNDVAKVSDRFFSGDIQSAFNKAAKLNFDSEELTRFSLNLDYQEIRQVAVNAYSQYQSASPAMADEGLSEQGNPSALKDMSQFVKQLDQLFDNPFAQHKFAHPEKNVADLFAGMNQLLHSEEMNTLQRDSRSLLDSLVEQLKQRHSSDHISSNEKSSDASLPGSETTEQPVS